MAEIALNYIVGINGVLHDVLHAVLFGVLLGVLLGVLDGLLLGLVGDFFQDVEVLLVLSDLLRKQQESVFQVESELGLLVLSQLLQ